MMETTIPLCLTGPQAGDFGFPDKPGIYKITCLVKGRFYIGSSQNIRKRLHQHFLDMRRGKHSNPRLQAAWNKYGSGAFACEVVELCDELVLLGREQYWIDTLKPYLNIAKFAAANMKGLSHSERAKEKMVAAKLGKKQAPSHVEKRRSSMAALWAGEGAEELRQKFSEMSRGRKMPSEAVERMAAKKRGQKRTPEQCARISAGRKGIIPNISDAQRANISHAAKTRIRTEEERAKLSESLKKREITPEWRANIGKSRRGRKASEETKAKMCVSQRARGKRSPEACKNIANGQKLFFENLTPEQKEERKARLKQTPECIARRIAAQKAQYASLTSEQKEDRRQKIILATQSSRKPCSAETRAKLSQTSRGRVMPRDGVEKSAAKRRGQKRTPEQCARFSASQKKRHEEKRAAKLANTLQEKLPM